MRDPHPAVHAPALGAFAAIAEEYCRLIEERHTVGREHFLLGMHALLPRLYLAGLLLPPTDILFSDEDTEDADDTAEAPEASSDPDRGEHEEWSQLYASLGALIGERNFYREIFDPFEPLTDPEVTGALADDFADIYRDVRAGLRKWQRGESGEALWEWRFNLESHWGEHLTGALRTLYVLSSTYDLGWPGLQPGAA
jgi:hypothetical protein